MGSGIARLLLALLALVALALPSAALPTAALPTAAHAASAPRAIVSPAEVAVGEATTVTISGLKSTAASATPTNSPTAGNDSAQAEPDTEAESGRMVFVLIRLVAAVVIGIGAVLVISKSRRGRRGD